MTCREDSSLFNFSSDFLQALKMAAYVVSTSINAASKRQIPEFGNRPTFTSKPFPSARMLGRSFRVAWSASLATLRDLGLRLTAASSVLPATAKASPLFRNPLLFNSRCSLTG